MFSGIIGNEDFRATFGYPGEALEGIIVSIYNLGCFSGCITAFLLCERLGRRKCMWLAMCFIIVSVPRCSTGASDGAAEADESN